MDATSTRTSAASSTSAPASVSTKSATTTSGRKQPTTSLTAGSSSSSKKAGVRCVMTWSDAKDLALLIEIGSINPFACRRGSKERGKRWTEVAELLAKQGFKVDQRAVRDRYTLLNNRNKQNNSKERKESGIAPEVTPTQAEITTIIEDLAQQDADSETIVEKNDEEQKKVDGIEMRKRLVETFAETNKRLTHTEENEPKRRRNSGNDVTSLMAMKLEMDRECRAQELQIQKDEAAQREVREEREQERRRQVEAENARKEAEKERKFELLQQQLLQQSNQISSVLMLLMQQQQQNNK